MLSDRKFQQLWIITRALATVTKGENPLLLEIPAIFDNHDSPSNSNLLSYRKFQQFWIITIVRWLNNFGSYRKFQQFGIITIELATATRDSYRKLQ
ncbi:hypothetical protein BJP34_10865 [Moorena producens PAL-8-15-08-1]|uniref:Uncharacterized protein n=1 Tax=Moorena producens PAL-8-15-08-1 TaxID=1458985 RepID=A0A1D8TQK1_9CYAN|nr:hypothetical protein BJP34_10865 [Moorena producens PAL-8-15-08-1]